MQTLTFTHIVQDGIECRQAAIKTTDELESELAAEHQQYVQSVQDDAETSHDDAMVSLLIETLCKGCLGIPRLYHDTSYFLR